jgi:hypothetical protein
MLTIKDILLMITFISMCAGCVWWMWWMWWSGGVCNHLSMFIKLISLVL